MMEKISYALGLNIAANLIQSGIKGIDTSNLARGIDDMLNGADLEMSNEEAGQLLQAFFGELQAKQQEAAVGASKEFLDNNAKQEGVVVLPSGLQYSIMVEGNGPKPTATDSVKCHYHGTLTDGTVFDSSVQRNEPAVFPVNGVIKGWVEALQLMPLGSKWKLVIPSDLAYGAQGAGQAIAPHSTLVFEVELLGIE